MIEFLEAQEHGPTAYEPREDSFLLLEAVAELSLEGMRVLDMGTGSGILAAYCAVRGAQVTASDIDSDAIQAVRTVSQRLGIEMRLVLCDLFAQTSGRFDLVAFNPPYLPSSQTDDRAVDGGEDDTSVIKRFLSELGQHLTEDGHAMFLISSLNRPQDLPERYPDMSFEVVRQRRLFFETLYVIRTSAKKRRA